MFNHLCDGGCNFDKAAHICEENGGHLPFIQNSEENDEILGIIASSSAVVWIGLISKYRKGSWQLYKTEDAATFFNFQDVKESGNSDGCVIMNKERQGKWKIIGCAKRKTEQENEIGVLCQRLPHMEARKDVNKRVMMGKSACDDAVKGIEKDLTKMESDTKCDSKLNANDRRVSLRAGNEKKEDTCEKIHEKYVPNHICMDSQVDYTGFGKIPTHGPHRPNWASFGEYSYLPIERWQHNLEHGCVVLLYHPCMDNKQVAKLKSVVSGCLRKHIITPSRLPTLSNPVLLVAWGCYLQLKSYDLERVKQFVRTHGLKGPEGNYTKDGLYTHLQVAKSEIPPGKEGLFC